MSVGSFKFSDLLSTQKKDGEEAGLSVRSLVEFLTESIGKDLG